jgi:lipoprotein-releasing system permease protein
VRFEAYVAMRYLRGKRKNRFVSLITMISVAGVSVGVIALIVVMGVMTGFDNALRATIIGNRSHLSVISPYREPIEDWRTLSAEIEALSPEIVASSPFIEVMGLLRTPAGRNQRYEGAYILGVDPELETAVTQLADNLSDKNGRVHARGSLPGRGEIVLGYLLADRLGVRVGDEIAALTPNSKGTPFGMRPGQQMWLTVSGVFQAQMSEFDTIYGFVTLETAQLLKGTEGVDGVHCKLTDAFVAPRVAARIEDRLPYRTVTWYESQQAFFEALEQEKVVMFIILVFIILVAAFNITSTLIMVVMEKRRDIGILRTIGVSSGAILRMFILEGLYIGMTGTLAGLVIGTLLARNLNPVAKVIAWFLDVDLFNSQIYYFDRIPVAVMTSDIVWIGVSAVLLTFLSTIYPAWSAARLDPVDALRYE